VSNPHGWIGVDLDGTLAKYDTWKGITHIGAPIPRMVRRVKRWLAAGVNVRIFTARIAPGEGGDRTLDIAAFRVVLEEWCLKHLGQALPVTCTKDFDMKELWDDRAVQVEFNTGKRVGARRR